MVKKQRRMRTSLRAASKVQERSLQALAEKLAEEPSLVLPECRGHGSHFKRAQKAIARAWEARNDEKKLEKLTRRGHPFGRAYAATLFVGRAREEQVIMLQVPTPWGKVPIASRGKAKAAHLVAMQNFDDRKMRLLLVLDLAKRKRLNFYSLAKGGIVCAGKRGPPPPEFLEGEAESLGLMKDPEGWACPHAIHAPERVTVRWTLAHAAFRRCGACAKEGNMLHTILEHVAAREMLAGFDVQVDLAPLPTAGAMPAEKPPATPLDPAALERYKKGELDDAGLLVAQRAARLAHLRTLPGKRFVNNGTDYGRDVEAFVASLGASPLEALALGAALAEGDKPIVQERGSAVKVLAELWQERGVAALEAVAGSRDIAEALHREHDVAAKGVGLALQQAQQRGKRSATDAALPSYRDLPAPAKLADTVARAHRAHGRAAALAALEQSQDARLKGLVHALELALGAGQGKEWKYSPIELGLAEQLRPHAATLLAASPEKYHDALRSLARAAGVSEELRKA